MKKILLTLGIVIIVFGTTFTSIVKSKNETPNVKVVQLKNREVRESIMIPGTLWFTQERYFYKDPQLGEVKEILVDVGDEINIGDPLFRYQEGDINLEIERNKLAIESNNLKVNNLKVKLNDLTLKQNELIAQIGEKEARKQTSLERMQFETEIKMADIELRTYLLEKKSLDRKKQKLEIKSDVKGTVLAISYKRDSIDSSNIPIIHIANTDSLTAKGSVSEFDSLKVKEKQNVKISSDIIPNETWKGVVAHVGSLPNQEQHDQVVNAEDSYVKYPVEISVIDNNIPVKPGFKLILEVEIEKRNALTIPWSAIKRDQDDNYYVYIVNNNNVSKQKVEAGSTFENYIEINKGLSKDDQIINNPSKKIVEGIKVSIK